MKNVALIILILLASISVASAGPFLICDPATDVSTYEVFIDGELVAQDVPAQADGSLKYDLAGTIPGVYNFTAKACNEAWGCSSISDPFVSPPAAPKPINLRLAK